VLFVGRLVNLKGVDLLLRAFAALSAESTELRLIGTGTEEGSLRLLADKLGIADSVFWAGAVKNSMVAAAMANADLLVLPSHKDGWGAVVNESLTVGTPVICSSACGAAELIRQPWLGMVFPTGRLDALAGTLKHWLSAGPRTQVERQRIRNWATCISGQAVAEYFVAIMDHVYSGSVRPVAPWRASLEENAEKLKL
jgi:glycosyltransferase involved in cell wall biosynthesis